MGRNILVVEDDKNISDLIYMYLVKEGFDVRIAGDGGKALEEFRKKEPDLGRMLFSGDDVFKPVKVLSGGEKVRCMLSRMMLYGSNVLVLDQPTNHLDLESITAVNNGLVDFKGVVLFASHDHEFVQTIANRIMVLEDGKLTDRLGTYEDYIASMAQA